MTNVSGTACSYGSNIQNMVSPTRSIPLVTSMLLAGSRPAYMVPLNVAYIGSTLSRLCTTKSFLVTLSVECVMILLLLLLSSTRNLRLWFGWRAWVVNSERLLRCDSSPLTAGRRRYRALRGGSVSSVVPPLFLEDVTLAGDNHPIRDESNDGGGCYDDARPMALLLQFVIIVSIISSMFFFTSSICLNNSPQTARPTTRDCRLRGDKR